MMKAMNIALRRAPIRPSATRRRARPTRIGPVLTDTSLTWRAVAWLAVARPARPDALDYAIALIRSSMPFGQSLA